jgi:hypothetical protein
MVEMNGQGERDRVTEPQQRVLATALRYWIKTTAAPRTADTLLGFLTDRLDDLRHWDELSEAEAGALNVRSAAVVAIRLRRLINESKSFYCTGMDQPLDVKAMVGRPADAGGRLVIVDLQGISDSARQIIVSLLSTGILNMSLDKSDVLSRHDIDELPALSTGEALVSGRSIPAPLLVKTGLKALVLCITVASRSFTNSATAPCPEPEEHFFFHSKPFETLPSYRFAASAACRHRSNSLAEGAMYLSERDMVTSQTHRGYNAR